MDTLKGASSCAFKVYNSDATLQNNLSSCNVIFMSTLKMKLLTPSAPSPRPPKLLDQVRNKIRLKHYSLRTEQAYVDWARRYIFFHCKRHPAEMGAAEVEAFLTHLAVEGRVAASTQNQARAALLFLYREVLQQELPWLEGVEVAKESRRIPVVLTHGEVNALLDRLQGVHGLIGRLLYGTGMRLMEAMRLRVKDIEFERREIIIRDGKGFKDRVTMLPAVLIEALKTHLQAVKQQHEDDLKAGFGNVYLPFALERKYPNAGKEWGLAVCVSGNPGFGRCPLGRDAPPSPR